jgi:hypothetical protein
MKVRTAMLAAFAMIAAPLAAQGGGQAMRQGGGMAPGMMGAAPSIDTLTAQLALTAEQQPKVEVALKHYTESTKDAQAFLAKLRESGNMGGMRDNPDAMKHLGALREARTRLATDIKAAITPEQAAKYDELYPQQMRRRTGGQ